MSTYIKILVFGGLACLIANSLYPPTEDNIVFFGVLAVLAVGGTILAWDKKEEEFGDQDPSQRKKLHLAIAIVPWLLCATLFVNGIADASQASPHSTKLLRISRGRYGIITVASWKSAGQIVIWLPFGHCSYSIVPGTTVTVLEKEGALGIPWVASIPECSR